MKNSDLTEFIYSVNKATSNNELTQLFADFINYYGYDKFVFGDLSHYSIKDKSRDFGILENYPDEWMDYYIQNNLPLIDPVYLKACTSILPFSWKDAIHEFGSEKSLEMMNQAKENGLENGIGLSVFLPGGRKYGLGLSSGHMDINSSKDAMSILQVAAHHLTLGYIQINNLLPEAPVGILAEKEKEVLYWIAEGKTKHEVGLILSLSTSAIKRHCENIFSKLKVCSLPAALAKAFRTGQLE